PTDPKADVFTAGVILWELCAKQRLFSSKIEAAVVQKVLTAPIAPLGTMAGVDATVAIDQAVQHALERDPSARAASLDELTDALDASGELATHEEVAAVVEKLAGKSIATRKNELSSLDGPSPSERPPAPKAPVRKATLQGVAAILDDATEVESPKAPSAQEHAPASVAKPPPPPAAASARAPLVTLDDSWVSSTGDTAVSADTAAAAAIAAAPKAPAPPPPPRRNAATIVGMAPFTDSAPHSPPPAPPPPKKEISAKPPTAVQKSLAEKLADRPAPPPKRANATLLLGSVGEPAEAKPAPSPEPAKAEPKPEPPKADEPKAALRSEAPAPTKVEGHTPSPLSLTPSSLGRAASALEGVQPGATLGRYEILMPIARGGMASVWAGRMQGTRGFSRIVAIKTMLPDISDDPDFQTMFLDEARVAARIKHPNVVQIIDLGEQDDVIYLVMDWVEGDTLGALQKAAKPLGGIPLPIVLRIAQQALAGLHAAHELRDDAGTLIDLVHRDVSPGNVLISMQGFVKIVDFGIAKSKARMHVTRAGGVVKGKTPYLSPEQLGQLPIDRRSDIFSFGCLLYVLTTGLHPFRGESEVKTVENIALKSPMPPRELNPDIPVELDKLILKTLEKDPAKRYATAVELQKAIVQIGATLEPTTDEDVSEFVKRALSDAQEKRSQDLKAAIAGLEESLSKPSRNIVAALGEATPSPLSPKTPAPVSPKRELAAEPAKAEADVDVDASAPAEESAASDVAAAPSVAEAPPTSDAATEDGFGDDDIGLPPRRPNLKYIVGAALGACVILGGIAVAMRGGRHRGRGAHRDRRSRRAVDSAARAERRGALDRHRGTCARPSAERRRDGRADAHRERRACCRGAERGACRGADRGAEVEVVHAVEGERAQVVLAQGGRRGEAEVIAAAEAEEVQSVRDLSSRRAVGGGATGDPQDREGRGSCEIRLGSGCCWRRCPSPCWRRRPRTRKAGERAARSPARSPSSRRRTTRTTPSATPKRSSSSSSRTRPWRARTPTSTSRAAWRSSATHARRTSSSRRCSTRPTRAPPRSRSTRRRVTPRASSATRSATSSRS
ncbi:MAG TPA: protein kinase, partial [Byssovorax sp.]